jgi:hypothetical protein
MEAALVLKENSQQPWDHGTSSKHLKEDDKSSGLDSLNSVQPHILSGTNISVSRGGKSAVAGQEQPLLQSRTDVAH